MSGVITMAENGRIEFTKEMKSIYKVLIPNMLPIQLGLLAEVFNLYGYNMELLRNSGRRVVECGLKYVHNDTCYPALLIIGQFIDALQSGKYDVHKTALMITQTGGGCRASNYIHLLRKALEKADLGFVPVISLNFSGLEKNSGFKIKPSMFKMGIGAVAYGDLLMSLSNQIRPYEKTKGESDLLVQSWTRRLAKILSEGSGTSESDMRKYMSLIVRDFERIPVEMRDTVKVGIVGEIFVKYSSLANNDLEKFLHDQGCEVMVPGLLGFVYFCIENKCQDVEIYGGSRVKQKIYETILNYTLKYEDIMNEIVTAGGRFRKCSDYRKTKEYSGEVISIGCKMGEGWLLPGEIVELIHSGFENVVCAQPFGCLPNHIVGKGMIRKIRELYPESNIVPIDYDPGATRVNQENRIKLMLAVAEENKKRTAD